MPKQQSSLDSFFGVGGTAAAKTKKKQKTLTSFFNKDKENNAVKKTKDNEDVVVKDNNKATTSTKQEEESTTTAMAIKRSKRRAIVDDSDSDEENDVAPMQVDNDNGEDDDDDKPILNQTADDEKKLPTPVKTTVDKTKNPSPTVTPPTSIKSETSSSKKGDNKKTAVPNKKEKEASSKSDTKKSKSNIKEEAESNDNENDDDTTTGTTNNMDNPKLKRLIQQAKKLAKQAKVGWDVDAISSPVLYKDVVGTLEQIEAITGRLEIQGILTKLFRRVLQYAPKDIYPIIYLCSNSIAPAYECVELGIGDSILVKAIGEAYGTKPAMVKEKYEKEGDLGTVAKSCKSKQRTLGFGAKPKPLTAEQVLKTFREISQITGNSSQKLKVDKIKKLLVAVQDSAETKYIIRGLQGKLRIGLAQSTVLISLAHALSYTIPSTVEDVPGKEGDDAADKNIEVYLDESAPVEKRLEGAVNIIKQVYSEVPSYDALLDGVLKVPLTSLHEKCSFQPGIPVAPMLAKPTKSIQEVLKRLDGEAFTCEYKYDGERAQIHKTPDGKMKVFSRNLLETSGKYPEVPLFVQEAASSSVTSFVLDAEVVAYNPKNGQLVPFQILSTRKKTEESAESAKVQVIVQAFDLMYLNGKSLLNAKLEERRALMKEHFLPVEGKFQYAKALDFVENGDTIALEQFLDAAVKGQCEGLMVKTMDDVYEPSRRSLNWLKLKKDYLEGLGDSVDLVPLGAYYGKGKRTGVYGAYLLACYDEDSEEFQSVCKIGTGFSDEDLKTLSAHLNNHKLDAKSSQYNVADGLECDVWFDAVQVWEVKAADLSKSSLHRGAIDKTGDAGRGIGLRFPRFERIREDKNPDQATTSDQILDMYYNQDTVKGNNNDDDEGDDDGI